MNHQLKICITSFLFVLLLSACASPDVAPTQSSDLSTTSTQPSDPVDPTTEGPTALPSEWAFIDDLGCFPIGCDLPPGMKELCQAFEAGPVNWPLSCSEMPGEACQALCTREKALAEETDSSPITTFVVKVPQNTLVSLGVFLELFDREGARLGALLMEQVGPTTWIVEVRAGHQQIQYRYMRDGLGFTTAEQFWPDSETAYRQGALTPGLMIEDQIEQWRWFPTDDEPMPVVESAAVGWDIQPRIEDWEFMRGYEFADFWWGPFYDLVGPTDQAMLEMNGNWIRLAPAWDYEQVDPLPVIGPGYGVFGHTYPEEMLEYHIEQAQADGLNVILTPQICCTKVDTTAQYSSSWWEAWFAEMNGYAETFSRIAEEQGIEYLVMGNTLMWLNPNTPADIESRFAEYLATVRANFSGQVGIWWDTDSRFRSDALYPTGYLFEEFDFFALGFNLALAQTVDASVEQMEAEARLAFDNVLDPWVERYDKPIIILSVGYMSVDGGLAGTVTDVEDPALQHYFEYMPGYTLDLEEQAYGYEALLRAVADTPYIVGFYPFNSHWPTPFRADKMLTLWGKPGGEVLSG
jgi:hypothetical protein